MTFGPHSRRVTLAVGALLLGFTLVLFRGDPRLSGDQGVFLSVAARMLDGDRLYSEVVDNKDPLFFYTYAGALWSGGWRAPFLLDGVWLALAGVSLALLLRELQAPRAAVIAGFFVYPLSLTSGWYEAGLSMLAALAIAPLAAWLWLRRSFGAAGAVLATVMLFKLNVAAVAAAPIAAFVLLGTPPGSRGRHAAKSLLGVTATMGAAAALLAVRGEVGAYLDTVVYNVRYSSRAQAAQGPLDAIDGHLYVVREFFLASGKWQAPTVILALGVFFVAASLAQRRGGRTLQLLVAASIATLIATVGTLALTAIWRHHLQMLAYPAALMASVGISVAVAYFGRRAGTVAAGALVLFALWSSAKIELRGAVSARAWTSDPATVPSTALEGARVRFYGSESPVTYMVFGGNSENAHAVFIDDAFALSCRWFHLYPFSLDEQFSETLDCAMRERPMLVLVTLGFFDDRAASPAWGSFVTGAERWLESRYELVSVSHPGFQVWKLKSMPSQA